MRRVYRVVRFANGSNQFFRVGLHGAEVRMIWHKAVSPSVDLIHVAPLCPQSDGNEIIIAAKKVY
jgi:hypothetical protein